jgi:DNA excision repair protein ERCC-3
VYDLEVEDTHNFVANGIVVHNCHHLPAERFSDTLFQFDAKYFLGLSATPTRFDGLDALLKIGLGGVVTETSISSQMIPEVWFVRHHTAIPERKFMQRKEHPYKPGVVVHAANLGRLVNELIRIRSRNEYIVKKAVSAAIKGRKVMVFSHRIRHLQWLKNDFDSAMNALVTSGEVPAPKTSSLFVGSVDGVPLTASERESAKRANVMFCTYKLAAEGLDVPEADTIIFATPASFVRQVVGRILRSFDKKAQPAVIDILDDGVHKLEIMAGQRAKEYRAMGAKVHLPSQSHPKSAPAP